MRLYRPRVLVACESSGKVRDAFIRAGCDAMSCDLLPTKRPGPHYQGDVRGILHRPWDMLIAFPTCTFLCVSGQHWVKRGRIEADGRPRAEHVEEGVAFARMFIDGPETAHIPRRVVENPIGILSSLVREPEQIIHPWMFGDDASKSTCLWLHGVDPLRLEPKFFTPPPYCCVEQQMGHALGQSNGQRPEQPAAERRPLGFAQRDISRRRRGDGRTVGACSDRAMQPRVRIGLRVAP